MDSPLLRRLLVAAAILCVLVTAGLIGRLWWLAGTQDTPPAALAAAIGGPFRMTDHNGRAVTDADFRGRPMIVYFGYTYCPDVCPTGLQTLAAALDLLGGDAARVWPVFVTVDPERDTVAQMKDYVAAFHPRLIGLTGTIEQVRDIARAYRVYFRKVTPEGSTDYLVDHSSAFYVMGKDGAFASHLTHQATPEAIAARLRTLL